MKSGCKWLGVIEGTTHMNFAGRGQSKKTETLTVQVIREFLNGVQATDCKTLNQISGMTLSIKRIEVALQNFSIKSDVFGDVWAAVY
jgi:hypothetical protein